MSGRATITGIAVVIIITIGLLFIQTTAALYRVSPPCVSPVIAEWKPLYPSLGALVANEPDSYQAIYRCKVE